MGRAEGLLRADAGRGASVWAEEYRQIELDGHAYRYARRQRHGPSGPAVAYRLLLPFLGVDLGDRFELARSRSKERCTGDYVLLATPSTRSPVLSASNFTSTARRSRSAPFRS